MNNRETFWLHLSKLFVCYLAISVVNGYVFGGQQMSALAGFAKYLSDPTLYGSDFYIEHLAQNFPNNYSTLAWIMAQFNANPFWSFISHLAISIFMFGGIYKIGFFLIRNKWLPYVLIIILNIPPFYGLSLSTEEIFINHLSGKLVAHACLVWVFYFWLVRNSINYAIFLSLGIFFHVTAGAQIWFLTLLAEIIFHFFRRRRALLNLKKWLIPHLIVTLIAGLWVFLFLQKYTESTSIINKVFEFLQFNSTAPFYKEQTITPYPYYAFTFFFVMAAYTFQYNLKFLILIVITGLGLIGYYSLMVAEFPTLLVNSQWLRATIWVELFALIAIMRWFAVMVNISILRKYEPILKNTFSALILVLAGFMAKPQILSSTNSYNFPWKDTLKLAEIDMAFKVKILTDKEPLVVIPPHFSSFRFYSERSVLVSFLSPISKEAPLIQWTQRMRDTYGLEIDQNRTYSNSILYATDNYKKITDKQIRFLKDRYCITHLVVYKNTPTIYKTVIDNDYYKLIEL